MDVGAHRLGLYMRRVARPGSGRGATGPGPPCVHTRLARLDWFQPCPALDLGRPGPLALYTPLVLDPFDLGFARCVGRGQRPGSRPAFLNHRGPDHDAPVHHRYHHRPSRRMTDGSSGRIRNRPSASRIASSASPRGTPSDRERRHLPAIDGGVRVPCREKCGREARKVGSICCASGIYSGIRSRELPRSAARMTFREPSTRCECRARPLEHA